jgi:putative DNA primase/helicase
MGDYAVASDMQTFTASKYDRHPTEIAKLAGARLVTATETESGRTWAWSRIKELTGNEGRISARFMRKDFFEFKVSFKLVFVGNDRPRLPSTDEATARRVNVVPFLFRATKPDPELKAKLREEGPAILRWLVDGCLSWQRNRLVRPSCVTEATQRYLDEQDLFALWVDGECETGLGREFCGTHKVLFASWSGFAKANGESPGSAVAWSERMLQAGFKPTKHTPGFHDQRGYLGIRLTGGPLRQTFCFTDDGAAPSDPL